ncbi:MAG: archaeosortase/exosortase family protein [Fimbriimonadaceae bacterium]|nr:archaeosortase/exosortase family protein [Alphaproteobacteria bacterium]
MSQPSIGMMRGSITRREVALWTVIYILANHALHAVDIQSLWSFVQSLASLNLIYWLACYVIVRNVLSSNDKPSAESTEIIAALFVGITISLTSFVGHRVGVGVMSTFVALYLLWFHNNDQALKAAGAVLLALSVHLVWGRILFQAFTPQLLTADAAAVDLVLSILRPDITLVGSTFYAANDHVVSLVGSCSSFNNVSIALLASVAVTMLVRHYWVRSDIVWLLAICIVMISINVLRLCVLAWDVDLYLYWHNGPGGPMLALAQTAIIGVMSYCGAMYGRRVE